MKNSKHIFKLQQVILLLLLFIISCQAKVFKNDLSKILGVDKVEIIKSQSTDEFGGFGEGYTLEIYELSEKTVQSFTNTSLKNLPDKQEGGTWLKYGWNKTPIDSSYKEIFIMGLNYDSGNKKLETKLNEIKKIIEQQNVYYSFYYKPDKENPRSIQLFILDIQNRKLYTIESII